MRRALTLACMLLIGALLSIFAGACAPSWYESNHVEEERIFVKVENHTPTCAFVGFYFWDDTPQFALHALPAEAGEPGLNVRFIRHGLVGFRPLRVRYWLGCRGDSIQGFEFDEPLLIPNEKIRVVVTIAKRSREATITISER